MIDFKINFHGSKSKRKNKPKLNHLVKPVFHLVKSITHCKRLFFFVEMKIYLVIGFLWTAIIGSVHLYAQDSLQVANAKRRQKD